jgi:hypothetical protein
LRHVKGKEREQKKRSEGVERQHLAKDNHKKIILVRLNSGTYE